jgi:hypothetical protein
VVVKPRVRHKHQELLRHGIAEHLPNTLMDRERGVSDVSNHAFPGLALPPLQVGRSAHHVSALCNGCGAASEYNQLWDLWLTCDLEQHPILLRGNIGLLQL